MTRLTAGSLLLIMVAGAPVAPAAARGPVQSPDLPRIEVREEQARAACSSGHLQEGTRILTDLFAQTDDGTYLFNLARCYQQNGRKDEALMRFRAYLRRPDGDPAAVAATRQYIAELERPLPVAPTARAGGSAGDNAGDRAGGNVVAASERPNQPPRLGTTLRLAGLVAGGVGLAAVGAGAYFAVRTRSLQEQQDEAIRAGRSDPAFYEDLNDRGDRAERLQWVFLGVGAAAISAGGVLYYLGRREPSRDQASLLVTPLVCGQGGGAILRGRF